MQEALYYTKLEAQKVQCNLCPRNCIIEEGRFGDCRARRNRQGTLYSEVFSKISAFNLDPIEKKPLYHFYPGSEIISLGTSGCNLHCVFCQNHTLSQCQNKKPVIVKSLTPEELLDVLVKTENNLGLAFTYNEPTINYEYMLETARLAKNAGLKTVMVSNGYINQDPLEILMKYIDAFNIDLKGYSNDFYAHYTKATIKPVLKTIKTIGKSDRHLEITYLVIPTVNDNEEDFERACKWIAKECGKDTVLHLSRYFPRYELEQYPTPAETLFALFDIAKKHLNHVYLGNMATELHSNSYCPSCNNLLIERTYFHIVKKGINDQGECKNCGQKVFVQN